MFITSTVLVVWAKIKELIVLATFGTMYKATKEGFHSVPVLFIVKRYMLIIYPFTKMERFVTKITRVRNTHACL